MPRTALTTIGALALFLAVGVPASAQSAAAPNSYLTRAIDQDRGLDADDLVALGLSRAPSVAALTAAITAARGHEQQAALRANPELTIQQRQQLGGSDRATTASVMWPLELGRVPPKTSVAHEETPAAEARLADARRLLEATIRADYGAVLAAARALTVSIDQLEAARSVYRLADERATSGSGPALERDQAGAEVAVRTAAVVGQERSLELARLRLLQSIGAHPADPIAVRGHLEDLADTTPTATPPGFDIANRADVREATAAVEAARLRSQVARSEAGWDVALYGEYMNMTMSFSQLGLSPIGKPVPIAGRFQSVAGGVTFRLPAANRNQGAIAAASADEIVAARRLDDVRLAAEHDIASAVVSFDQARRAARILKDDAVARTRANVEVLRQAYGIGTRSLSDVLAGVTRLNELEAEYTSALLSSYQAWVDLRAATAAGERQ